MPYHRETSDADFFALVHHVLENNRNTASSERRVSDRREYTCQQYIAPYVNGSLPKQSEFQLFHCLDLSPSGFSFLSPTVPTSEYLIVALGSAPYIFVSACVVHCKSQRRDDEQVFLVGCRFVARIKGAVYGSRLGETE